VSKGDRYVDGSNRYLIDVAARLAYADMAESLSTYDELLNVGSGVRQRDIALLGCLDRFFLCVCVLGRRDLIHPWLYDRCREVEAQPDGYLDLWAREHGKSSLITCAGVIQEVLIDPELTVAIFSGTQKSARKFLHQIKQEFETNAFLREAYADVVWQKPKQDAPRWGLDGIVLRRTSNPKEATVEAWGLVDGMPTGGHYGLLVYDDIVTLETVRNPEMVRKATESWEMSDNLGAGNVRKQHIGTRYSFGDTWGQILERNVLKPRIYPGSDDGTPTGNPVFMAPERWREKLKTQRSTFSAQMLLNPLAGSEQVFKPEWFESRWDVRPATLNVYIMVDPSAGRTRSSDNCAMAVVGVDKGGSRYFLDGHCHRMGLTERWDTLRLLWRKWKHMPGVKLVKVGYEKYGMQADLEHFQLEMQRTGEAFSIEEIAWPREGEHSKWSRIERLEPDIRDGRFYFPALISVKGCGDCYWHMAANDGSSGDGTRNHVVTIPFKGPSRAMRAAKAVGRDGYIVRGLRRKDADGEPYDLTRMLIDELLYFKFAPHDDIADATSRFYDMQPVAPDLDEQKVVEELNDMSFEDA
jgi:hypothetical protein